MGTLDTTALTLNRFGSQDQVNIDGNTITVPDDATNAQAGLEANGTGKVILDTSNFTISGGELLNSESESDTVFTGTGAKVDRFIKIDAPAIKLPSGSSVDQQTKANMKQGELFWNSSRPCSAWMPMWPCRFLMLVAVVIRFPFSFTSSVSPAQVIS